MFLFKQRSPKTTDYRTTHCVLRCELETAAVSKNDTFSTQTKLKHFAIDVRPSRSRGNSV